MVDNRLCFLHFLIFGNISAWTISRSHMYEYGPKVDSTLMKRDRGTNHATMLSPEVLLDIPIVFYNETYYSINVNANGLLSFLIDMPDFLNVQFPLDYPVIAPFYANVDMRNTGNVYFRETQDPVLLTRATNGIRHAFQCGQNFTATSLFVATWHNVSYYELGFDKVNTFQVVIANNGTDSYVEYHYPEGGIQWIEGESMDIRLRDARAQVGMVAGDGRFYTLQTSGMDQVQHIERLTNVGQQGVWMFHIGQINRYGNVMTPDLKESGANSMEGTCSKLGATTCHSKAVCFDYEYGFCCLCREGYYGNGINCLTNGVPLRINGKLSGCVNDVELDNIDVQSYVITSDGRIYTAVSRVPESVGYEMQLLHVIGSVVGWLFARPMNNTFNGYGLTGGVLNHTSTIKFPQTGQKITVWQNYQGPDVFNQLIVDLKIQGTLPSIPQGINVEIPEYEEHYIRSAPGTIISRTNLYFRLGGVPVRNSVEVEHIIHYIEYKNNPLNISDLHTKITRNLVVYEALQNVVRYGMTSKTFSVEDHSPCQDGRIICNKQITNSICIVDGYDYQCICQPGYQYLTDNSSRSVAACVDVNECSSGIHDCHLHAQCVNEDGSFRCTCNTGYSGDGHSCRDFSLCENDCHENAQCIYKFETDLYECACNPGYKGNGSFCENITFCNVNNSCEDGAECLYDDTIKGFKCKCDELHNSNGTLCLLKHSCKNETSMCSADADCVLDKNGYFKCQCNKGFVGNGTVCNLISQQKQGYLLYLTQGMAVLKFTISEDKHESVPIIMKPLQEAIGIAVDCVEERIYWSDIAGMNIRSALYNGSDMRIFLNSDLGSLEGISIDWISRNIYWTDSGKDTIEVANLDHKQRKIIISNGLVNPRGIAVHPEIGIMFWSDWNRSAPKLESANLDGSERKVFLQGDFVSLPNSLAIDWQSNELCWADAGISAIVCAAISNPRPRTVANAISYPFGLAITEANYFWTDWETQRIESMQKVNGYRNDGIISPLRTTGKLYGLAVVPGECRKMSNVCASANAWSGTSQPCFQNGTVKSDCACIDSNVEGSGSEP